MSVALPASLLVLERGWLSANNILFFDGDEATLVDSGYVTHAAQTVDLVGHALRGRRLKTLINTHSHSDHIGGNAALQAAFGCEVMVPAGLHATIADWDEVSSAEGSWLGSPPCEPHHWRREGHHDGGVAAITHR